MGKDLGLPADFGYQVIKQVGNYGEVFERNIGMGSPLKIERGLNEQWTDVERGLNAQWTDGGLQYAMPVR
jgi:general L-amino acid transport system substrate-binding protein